MIKRFVGQVGYGFLVTSRPVTGSWILAAGGSGALDGIELSVFRGRDTMAVQVKEGKRQYMANGKRKRLGELLCEKSYLDPNNLQIALQQQQQSHRKLGLILLELGYVSEPQLLEALSIQAGIDRVDLTDINIPADVVSLVPADLVYKYHLLPLRFEDGRLAVAMTNPFQAEALEDLRLVTGSPILRYYADPLEMDDAILRYYGSNVARMLDNLAPKDQDKADSLEGEELSADQLSEIAREPSLVNLVNLIILEALEERASDIHIEPFEHELKIKYRIDGMLVEKTPSSKRLHPAIVSRIKIMANMNIAERFVPQDGRIEFATKKGKIDLRVSTLPTVYGEAVVMRILDKSAALMDLEDLGMRPETLAGFEKCLRKAYGIVLVTGPTGCGKTTTLYAALKKIYSPAVKMITIEDPVEYQLDGINQIPVNPKRGLTFATGLRHILRHDPDIVMVGEIRDRETADIAIRAALTGHLVFSTLHTNDAAGAVTRLIDMGIEPFLLASSLEGVLAQRLVRKICPHCKEPCEPDWKLLRGLNGSIEVQPGVKFYRGCGCKYCGQTGMLGRMGVFELLRVTSTIRDLIAKRPTTDQIIRAAPPDYVSMVRDGILKVMAGQTTPEEVMRVAKTIGDE
ncbi:MAG: GspE/PulE family protein [Sedimentisphaerales bacterium]|nr:GspE/PulE family protein [Sedimentisphaerales bacterium]